MTPLAQHLAKQLIARPKERHPYWRNEENSTLLRSCLDDVHFFEVTAVWPLVKQLWEATNLKTKLELLCTFAFLPASKIWLESRDPVLGKRVGFFAGDCGDGRALVYAFGDDHYSQVGEIGLNSSTVYAGSPQALTRQQIKAGLTPAEIENKSRQILSGLMLTLVVINSPRIIGRRQYMPHAGLQRKLTKSFGVGKFPLHAWTEILLEVSKPPEIDDGEPHEAHLTGRRALHFCRKHIRIRLGQLEYVSAHWRGDPAIGIKRSRYTVTP